MDQDIEAFLQANVTAENLIVLRNASQACEMFELEDYEDSILDLIFSAVDQEEQAIVATVTAEFRAKIVFILGLHDITMMDNAPLEMLVDLCLGLKAIDSYLDMDSVIDICDGEEKSIERFAEVMALVTKYTSDEIMTYIEVLNEGLVDKIRALAAQLPDEVEAAPNTVTIEAISRYRLQIAPDELSYHAMIDAGLPLGMTFKTYLDFYSSANKSIDLSDPIHLKQFVLDLVGMTLMSSDAYANPIMYVQQTLTSFTSEVNISLQADIMAKRILQRHLNEKN